MTERLDELVKILSDLMVDTGQRKDAEAFLEIAIAARLLFRAIPGAEKERRSALYSIENALSLLIPKEEEAVDLSTIKMACSFCGRQRPEVMLGAGPDDVFICNECVDLFREIFHGKKQQSESTNDVS